MDVGLNYSTVLSTASLLISGGTAWLTLFRRGTVKMTKPTLLFFGPDGKSGPPKVYLRTLLYSTAKRGHIVESMFVRLRRGESVQNFNVWVYGDDRMARGSGIYVGHEGLASNHHFLLPRDGTGYDFLAGEYSFQVYALLVGRRSPLLLSQVTLHLSPEQSAAMKATGFGCFFDWGPDSQKYHAHVDRPPLLRDADAERLLTELTKAVGTGAVKP
jgi:hypothetical protein